MKRLYFLAAVATLQIVLGSLTMFQAAQPVRMADNVLVTSGDYYSFEVGILGDGRLRGNLSEIRGHSFDVFVFDERGYASFRDGSNAVPPLFHQHGTTIQVDQSLPGGGSYYVVAVDLPAREDLQVHLDLVVFGLKPTETIVAVIVLVGGLALVGAALMLSVWSWRRSPSVSKPSTQPPVDPSLDPPSDPSPDPSPDPPPVAQEPQDPPDDNTRIY
ncbi:MAG: hypothetical protein E6J94_02765 [Methanobacteriota archaeon]|nr:MAG: hypothetical protein E6J99_04515 [Euryarchaeota archaeon]TMA08319.1 MAG: hypothetical protein E6J94_02765 [Euryarchaeota archaeon]